MSAARMQERAELVAAAAARIAPSGVCSQCEESAKRRVTVCVHHAASGPGAVVSYRVPCARIYARTSSAPAWLAEDLAIIDAAAAADAGRRAA